MEALISVIVPVYNTAPYLEECIRSVLGQSCQAWELLLIDDGSTDGGPEICQRFAGEDTRIRLFRQAHKGVSVARNLGLREAGGDYLFFLDSDDAIHPRLLETLYGLMGETGAAMAAVEEQDIWANPLPQTGGGTTFHSRQEALALFAHHHPWGVMLASIGGKLIRKSTVDPLTFDEAMQYGEDTWFIYQLLAAGADVAILHQHWYYYRRREEGASQQRTVQAYQEIFNCHHRILCAEWESGRHENADAIALKQSDTWFWRYQRERRAGNRALAAHIRQLARRLEEHPTHRQLPARQRLKCLLGFRCYPAYAFLHFFSSRLWLWRQQRTAKQTRKATQKLPEEG